MASKTIPLAVPDDLMIELKDAAKITGMPRAGVMRQSMKLGLPALCAQYSPQAALKPFTAEEARRAFAPDPEWDRLETAMARRPRRRPEAD